METEKLTLSDCFKYPNASILNTWSNGNSKTDIETFLWRKGENIGNNISDCKLILRPLSSLTDEENCLFQSLQVIHQYENGEVYYYDSKDSTDYLRSINIDIDGLQERGVAVYE